MVEALLNRSDRDQDSETVTLAELQDNHWANEYLSSFKVATFDNAITEKVRPMKSEESQHNACH